MNIYFLFFLVFLLFFFLVDFFWFVSKSRFCKNSIEHFDVNCVSKNIITLSELLINNQLTADTILQQIEQIPFHSSEINNFNPILRSTFITSAEDRIEHLKQSIMLNYIINCADKKYNSISQLNDIRYLNSKDSKIQAILNNRHLPSSKILDILSLLQKNIHT